MATRQQIFSDDFNRAGPGLGGDWINPPLPSVFPSLDGYTLVSNEIYSDGPPEGFPWALLDRELGPDHYAEFTVDGVVSAGYIDLTLSLRSQQVEDDRWGYYFGFYGETGWPLTWYTGKLVDNTNTWYPAGSGAETGHVVADIVDGTVFRVEVLGDSLRWYIDGVLVGKWSDYDVDGIATSNGFVLSHYSYPLSTSHKLDNVRVGTVIPIQHKMFVNRHSLLSKRHKTGAFKRHNDKVLTHQS